MRATGLSDPIILSNIGRASLVYLGIIQALVVGKVAVLAARRHDWERACEYASFGLAIVTPALFLMRDFGEVIRPLSVFYGAAVGLGAVWVCYRVRFDLRFRRLRRHVQHGTVIHLPAHRR